MAALAADCSLSMIEADQHTLEDLELLAAANRRRRAAQTLRLAQGMASAWDRRAWQNWQGDMLRVVRGDDA